MRNKVLVSAALGGRANEHKVRYFESLEKHLNQSGHTLLLINYSIDKLETDVAHINIPKSILDNHISKELQSNQLTSDKGLVAAAVDSEYYQRDLLTSSLLLQKYSVFMEEVLDRERPILVILWCQFIARHIILKDISQKRGIACMYSHLGLLPGTIEFEAGGQVAESHVAQNGVEFEKLPLNEDDRRKAKEYIDMVRNSEKTRKFQVKEKRLSSILELSTRENRKVVFFVGNNDFYSGFWPSWIPNAQLHSPIFINTLEALSFLEQLAIKNDWQIIFKPHPNIETRHQKFESFIGDRVYFATGANIFECINCADVVATISSTVSYLSLIHEKPVLMLGVNQLYKKNVSYEFNSREEIEDIAINAMDKGFDVDMKHRVLDHIARLLKYYVFSFDDDIKNIVGRDSKDCANYILEHTILTSQD